MLSRILCFDDGVGLVRHVHRGAIQPFDRPRRLRRFRLRRREVFVGGGRRVHELRRWHVSSLGGPKLLHGMHRRLVLANNYGLQQRVRHLRRGHCFDRRAELVHFLRRHDLLGLRGVCV